MLSLPIFTMGGGNLRLFASVATTIVLSTQVAFAQQALTIKGTVKDANNEALIGVNVRVKGSTQGVATDLNGQFVLRGVAKDAVLEVSYVGMQTQLVPLNGKTELNITLKDESNQLSDVVVVGYGVQRKVNLTGSVSAIKGDELALRPVTNATQSLQGLVPGLTVSNGGSGRPGASASLRIRGQGNLSGSSGPYVLVDGVEMSLSDLNPNDIESISVLKDAAASAIYGARAAYGVILVTTKRGEAGKVRISYQGNVGWSSPTVLPKMVNALEFAKYFNAGVRNASGAAGQIYSDEKLALLEKYIKDPTGIDPWAELGNGSLNDAFANTTKGVANVDHFKLHYKDWAFKQNHNLSLSGGNKATQYYVSAGLYNEEGILRYAKMNYSRFNFASNLSSQMYDWLKLKLSTKFTHSQNDTPLGDGGVGEGFYHSLARNRPHIPVKDPNGRFTELSMIPYLQSGSYTSNKHNTLNLSPSLELTPLKDWRITLDYTYRANSDEYEALARPPLIYEKDNSTTVIGKRSELSIPTDGRFTRSMHRRHYHSISIYSNYLLTLGKHHNFVFLLGMQGERSHSSTLRNSITGLFSFDKANVAQGTGDKVVADTRNGWATLGYFARINYDYDGRYLVELNGRYDGSSRFAPANRWGFFPSASLGWNITREHFMASLKPTLSNLKLRASYGLLGNQAGAGLYTFASTMGLSGLGRYIFPEGRRQHINPPSVISPDTTWEKVQSLNLGLDFGLWSNALTGSFDIFQRDTRDMLGPALSLADLFGAKAPQTNNANMRNRGWELSLTYKGRIGKDIDYHIGGSLSDATSVVTKYENVGKANPAEDWYEGKEVDEIWGYRTAGLLQNDAEAQAYNEQYDLSFISREPWRSGDVKYIDVNGDGKINKGTDKLGDMGDMQIIGNKTPRYEFNINGGISYKGLSLSFVWQGVGKRDWNPEYAAYFWGAGPYAQVTVFPEHLDYWREDNPGAYYPRPYIHSFSGVGKHQAKNKKTSDRWLQNAAYIRLKNLSLSYDLPQSWVGKLGLTKAQVFFSGENLLTFTPLQKMFDPEAIFTRNSYTDEGGKNYPMNRVLSCGLIVNL